MKRREKGKYKRGQELMEGKKRGEGESLKKKGEEMGSE